MALATLGLPTHADPPPPPGYRVLRWSRRRDATLRRGALLLRSQSAGEHRVRLVARDARRRVMARATVLIPSGGPHALRLPLTRAGRRALRAARRVTWRISGAPLAFSMTLR